jgi:glycosyltransferase involved in cell wall biosynthesis
LRILLICDTYPPVMGGSEVEAQRVSAALIRRGHQVHVLCSGGPPMPAVREWTDPAGVPVSILTRHARGRFKSMVFACEVAWAIWSRRNTFDLVYFLMQGLHLASGLPVAKMCGKPIVMKVSGSAIIPAMQRSTIGRLELRWLRDWASAVMILNDGMVKEAVAGGLSRDRLVWMPNPVDVEEFRPPASDERTQLRQRYGIPTGANVVIYVGRLSHEKGLTGLIRGFASAGTPNAQLILVGDGPQRAELEALASEQRLGLEQIRFTGRIDVTEVPCWLRAADVFALVSPNEGFSCALVEAMASGLASVVSAIPANLQMISDGVHGLAVPFDDEKAIGEALARLLGQVESRRKMGESARLRAVNEYSTIRVVELYEALFDKVTRVH